jgi:hypothetical protein
VGITISAARFLIQSRAAGTTFGRVLTLGRQNMQVTPARLRATLDDCGLSIEGMRPEEFQRRLRDAKWPFEELLRLLGADEVVACDASAYEGATIVHDLNVPVPAHLDERFDTVIDAGTLEHVFNFPVAIKSAMEMVKTGGRLFIMTPANNYFGHGFYQFSPELFYRVLSAENGYRVERMIALVDDGGFSSLFGRPYFFRLTSKWYSVEDPKEIRKRVTLLSTLPVTMFVEARRMSIEKIFGRSPQQSDYSAQWAEGSSATHVDKVHTGRGWTSSVEYLPGWMRWRLLPALLWLLDPLRLVRWRRRNSFLNREFFRETDHNTRHHS